MEIKVLSRSDLEQILDMKMVSDAVQDAFIRKAEDSVLSWPSISHEFEGSASLDIRAGAILGDSPTHGVKVINDFPENNRKGLPSYSGLLLAFDSDTGLPLGLLDSSYINCMRSGAAGALSAAALGRADARTILIVGAGRQAFFQLGAILSALPQYRSVIVCNPHTPERATHFIENCPAQLADKFGLWTTNVSFEASYNLQDAVAQADLIVTTTASKSPLIQKDWVKAGTHLICVGADTPSKEEIDPLLFHGNRIFCDDIKQCARCGEIEVPFKTGIFRQDDFAGELGHVLSGQVPGRTSDEEITIFDSAGFAALDLSVARVAVDEAIRRGRGLAAQI